MTFVPESLEFPPESLEISPESLELIPEYIPKYTGTEHLQEYMENKDTDQRLVNVQTFTQP